MRFRSSLGFVVAAAVLASACGGDDVDGPPKPVHEAATRGPVTVPRMESKLLPNVPHAWPLARTKAGLMRAPNAAPGPDGSSGTNTAALITTNRNLVQKTLLLTADAGAPAYLAAKSSLDRIGVPYQSLVVVNGGVPTGLDPNLLTDGVSTCFFSSVILATDSLGYVPAGGSWTSAFSATDWQTLADFEASCSAREAIWYAYPNPNLGFTWPTGGFDWQTPVDATFAQPSFFAAARTTAKLPIRYAAGYLATIDATSQSLITDDAGNTLLALHTYPDGRESVISTFDQSPYLVHSLVLEYDLVRWVTRGMFLGKKRAYLTAQIDDVFIDDDMWVTGVGNFSTVQFRISGSDVDGLVSWQNGLRATLPSGSSFSTVLAFNGVGTLKSSYSDPTLLNELLKYNKSFLWLSHTWDHENLDAMLQTDAYTEANKNIKVANNYKLNGFSKTELVTPDVSGLGNLAALEGLFQAGVRFVVSNTSVAGGGNPSFNVGITNAIEPRIYEVPRHPTNMFYDVATPADETDEYNHYYSATLGTLSYEQVLDTDATIGAMYLFNGDIDPLMFHQPNLANYNAGTDLPPHSLYGDWIAAVTGKFLALSMAPIKTLHERDIAAAMQQRDAYNQCGVTATIVESTTGSRSLQLQATNACVVPVTGLSASSAGSVESYLGTTTTSVSMSAGSVKTIALP